MASVGCLSLPSPLMRRLSLAVCVLSGSFSLASNSRASLECAAPLAAPPASAPFCCTALPQPSLSASLQLKPQQPRTVALLQLSPHAAARPRSAAQPCPSSSHPRRNSHTLAAQRTLDTRTLTTARARPFASTYAAAAAPALLLLLLRTRRAPPVPVPALTYPCSRHTLTACRLPTARRGRW